MTPAALFELAYRNCGIKSQSETIYAEDMYNAFALCNVMLAQWQRKRWLIWHLVTTSKVSTGAQSYTVGSGGDYNIARPDRIESAFVRLETQSDPYKPDYPLTLIEAREDYNRIGLKQMPAFPTYLFYDSNYPLGSVYPWPVPAASTYSIHITTKATLASFTSLQQTLSIPEEIHGAIVYNLGTRLRVANKLPPDPSIDALAREALNVVRGANAQIPRLTMPSDFPMNRRGAFDYIGDTNS